MHTYMLHMHTTRHRGSCIASGHLQIIAVGSKVRTGKNRLIFIYIYIYIYIRSHKPRGSIKSS